MGKCRRYKDVQFGAFFRGNIGSVSTIHISYADSERDGYANVNSNQDTDSNGDRYANTNTNSNWSTNADSHTNGNPYSDGDAHSDRNSYANTEPDTRSYPLVEVY